MTNQEIEEDEESMMFSIETIERVLMIRDYIHLKEGRMLSFTETLDYIMTDYADKMGVLDDLKKIG